MPVAQTKQSINDVPEEKPPKREAILGKLTGQAYLFGLIAFDCGLRSGETLGLERKDFKKRPGYVYIQRQIRRGAVLPPKRDEVRFVKLTPRVIDAVNAHPANIKGDYLWSVSKTGPAVNKGDRMRTIASLFATHFHKACDDLGIRKRSTYKTRSTYASIGLSAGRSAESLSKQLGHSITVFYKHYGTLMQDNEMLDDEQARVLAFEERQMAKAREEAKKPKLF